MYRCASGELRRGFTVIELLVVLAAIALLLSIAAPRYIAHLDQAREVALKHDLRALRDAIDKFNADQLRYPETLDELVARRYLRSLPIDPITQRADSWVLLMPADGGSVATAGARGVADVRSGAKGRAQDGSDYAGW